MVTLPGNFTLVHIYFDVTCNLKNAVNYLYKDGLICKVNAGNKMHRKVLVNMF